MFDLCVVAGGDALGSQLLGEAQEPIELEVAVAGDAGVGGATALVLGDEVADHLLELLFEVQGVEGDIHTLIVFKALSQLLPIQILKLYLTFIQH